jgi:hypothetical protein
VVDNPVHETEKGENVEFDVARPSDEDRVEEALDFLTFVNSGATTHQFLEKELGLQRRAARAIVAHRDGPDLLHGTGDDGPFVSVMEVYGVRFVGTQTISRIMNHVIASGWEPGSWDITGVYDGVPFAAIEAEAALHVANVFSEVDLVERVGLSRTAAYAIVAFRPLQRLSDLSALERVGPIALVDLLEHGMDMDCATSKECVGGWECLGVPEDQSFNLGKCRDVETLEREGEACLRGDVCGEGMVCSDVGLPEGGVCVPRWARGSFDKTPERELRGVSQSGLMVYGLGVRRDGVVLSVDIDHHDPSDLVIELTAPCGAHSVVWDRNAEDELPSSFIVFGLDEGHANGRWTLTITDEDGDRAGTLRAWGLDITSLP